MHLPANSKDYVMPSECLELPWRPLYEILDRLYFYSARKVIYIRRECVAMI